MSNESVSIKVVGVEGDSVLIKYATDNSLKNIDEYDAVAYQPARLGYSDMNDFLEGIKAQVLEAAKKRDAAEDIGDIGLEDWVGQEVVAVVTSGFNNTTNPYQQTNNGVEVIL